MELEAWRRRVFWRKWKQSESKQESARRKKAMASEYGDPSDEDEEIQVFVRKETGGGIIT